MKKFANTEITWLNMIMKNQTQSIKNKIISKYFEKSQSPSIDQPKRSDINFYLIGLKKKKMKQKENLFFSSCSTCLILFISNFYKF